MVPSDSYWVHKAGQPMLIPSSYGRQMHSFLHAHCFLVGDFMNAVVCGVLVELREMLSKMNTSHN